MEFELHVHTCYSDGIHHPSQILRACSKLGLSGLAITDHDTLRAIPRALSLARDLGMILIPGLEISTAQGHLIALGIQDIIPPGIHVEEALDLVSDQGGISILPHPFSILRKSIFRMDFSRLDGVEIYNARSVFGKLSTKGLELCRRFGLCGLAGSDAHSIWFLGYATIVADAHDSQQLLECIRKHDFSIKFKRDSIRDYLRGFGERILKKLIR